MVSNQLLNSNFSSLSLEASHSLCLVLPEQGAALRFPSKPRRQAMLAPQGASGSAPRAEAARRPYRNAALVGTGHLQEHHQHPRSPATCGWVGVEQAASSPQAGAGGCWGYCAVLCWWCWLSLASTELSRCCFPGACPVVGAGAGHCSPHACPGVAPLWPVHGWVWLLPRHPALVGSELWL